MSATIGLPAVALVAVPPVSAIYVGPGNAIALTGHPWRWCRDTARRFGVPILRPEGSAASMIPAGLFAEAIARHGIPPKAAPAAPEPGSADELEAMRRQLRDARRRSPSVSRSCTGPDTDPKAGGGPRNNTPVNSIWNAIL